MKKNIHSKNYKKKIIMSNGSTFNLSITSTLNKNIILEVDPINNNVWNPNNESIVESKGQLSKFFKKLDNN
jgi:ribosomal protein L31